jgi:hypothetical protein
MIDLGTRASSTKKPKKVKKAPTPKTASIASSSTQLIREEVVKDRQPNTWDEAEKWIISKCESHEGAPVSVNISEFISRLELLLRDGDIASSTSDIRTPSSKPEMFESKPEPVTRTSPRLGQPSSTDIKMEESDPAPAQKRQRGRPRKSISQQLLTNYFQVQPLPASPILDENVFNAS